MPVAIETKRLVRRRHARAQRQIAPRSILDFLEDGAPLFLDARDRVIAADRLQPLDCLAMGAVRFGMRLIVMRRPYLQASELGGERRRVGPLQDRSRGLNRGGDAGADDGANLFRNLRAPFVAAPAVLELDATKCAKVRNLAITTKDGSNRGSKTIQ